MDFSLQYQTKDQKQSSKLSKPNYQPFANHTAIFLLQYLPFPVLREIIKHLNLKDRKNLKLVCKVLEERMMTLDPTLRNWIIKIRKENRKEFTEALKRANKRHRNQNIKIKLDLLGKPPTLLCHSHLSYSVLLRWMDSITELSICISGSEHFLINPNLVFLNLEYLILERLKATSKSSYCCFSSAKQVKIPVIVLALIQKHSNHLKKLKLLNFNDGEIKPVPVALQSLSASCCSARVVLSALSSSFSSLTSLSLFKITEGELFSDVSLPLLTDLTIAHCSHFVADYLVNSSLKTLEKVTIKDRSALNIVIKEDFYKLKSLFIENPYSISTFLSRSRNTLEHFFVRYFLSNPVYSLPNLSLLVLSVWNSEIFKRGSFTNLKTLIILRGQNCSGLQGYEGEFSNLEKVVLPEDISEYVDDFNVFVEEVKKKCAEKIEIKFINILKDVNNLKFPDDFMNI